MEKTAAQTLIELRTRLGWTQTRVAEYLGLTRSAVSLLEAGARQPSGSTRKMIEHLKHAADAAA